MKNKEIRELTDEELDAKIAELVRERYNLKCQFRTGELKDTAALRRLGRDVARLKTELTTRKAKAVQA
jgi:large subunit ribosomal protein L29